MIYAENNPHLHSAVCFLINAKHYVPVAKRQYRKIDEKEVQTGNQNNGWATDRCRLIHLILGWKRRRLWPRVRKQPAGEAGIVNVIR